MEENIVNINDIPYIIKFKEGTNENASLTLNNLLLTTLPNVSEVTYIPSMDYTTQQVIFHRENKTQIDTEIISTENQNDALTEVVDNQEISVSPAVSFVYEIVYPEELNLKPVYGLKRGRPKKQKLIEEKKVETEKILKPPPRTRSGRVVKFPTYIEKDFQKIELQDEVKNKNKSDVKTSDFQKFKKVTPTCKAQSHLELHRKKRMISAQYRCPRCNKAYLGKNKIFDHIKKNPTHGPVPESKNNLNFEVWNYLVDVTQKCPPAQRGIKFCEELTNLLHNLLLLTSALFKKIESNKSMVKIDKVLGNAIGLSPGSYHFDDTKLYKDVTVLKLITNNDFFKPVETQSNEETEEKSCSKCEENKQEETKIQNNVTLETTIEKKIENGESMKTETPLPEVGFYFNESSSELSLNQNVADQNKIIRKTAEVTNELLSDNSLLSSLPNLRNSVDELILSAGNNLLDASSSSDELMNVDQFVNERFKKITETEIELNNPPLNLDLPSLDLFQFHST